MYYFRIAIYAREDYEASRHVHRQAKCLCTINRNLFDDPEESKNNTVALSSHGENIFHPRKLHQPVFDFKCLYSVKNIPAPIATIAISRPTYPSIPTFTPLPPQTAPVTRPR
jgi:hypothetical protein